MNGKTGLKQNDNRPLMTYDARLLKIIAKLAPFELKEALRGEISLKEALDVATLLSFAATKRISNIEIEVLRKAARDARNIA